MKGKKTEAIHLEADFTQEIMIPDEIKPLTPKHATVIAVAYKDAIGTVKLQQRLVTYAHNSDVKSLMEQMKQGVENVDGKLLAMSALRLKTNDI